jgi:hypothetical protein
MVSETTICFLNSLITLSNLAQLYDQLVQELGVFNQPCLEGIIRKMQMISLVTSLVAQKVDGLKSFRNLDDVRQELTFRFRNGFFNVSFSSEIFKNDEFKIQMIDELKVYLSEFKNISEKCLKIIVIIQIGDQAQMILK